MGSGANLGRWQDGDYEQRFSPAVGPRDTETPLARPVGRRPCRWDSSTGGFPRRESRRHGRSGRDRPRLGPIDREALAVLAGLRPTRPGEVELALVRVA